MNKIIMTSMLSSFIPFCFVQAANTVAQLPTPDRVSIFKVSLQCPAAPQIGCGSASKPILLELERDPAVEQAWLNRAGTLIAVVWKSQPNAQTQQAVASRLRSAGCCAREAHINEVQGEARDQTLKEFQSGRRFSGRKTNRDFGTGNRKRRATAAK
jgi:hypothetical protein